MKKVNHRNCPCCGHSKAFKIKIGQTWINDRDYKVQILDFGFDDVWLLYIENGNKCAWNQDKFLQQYTILEDV